jgi:indole-3-glycerol phosphate synthase
MTILQQIVSETRARLAGKSDRAYRAELEKLAAAHTPRGFRKRLVNAAQSGPAVIAELKKSSPSKGVIRSDFPVVELARAMELAGAAALSVLTEEKRFQGSLENLQLASHNVSIPCVRKDFIVDEVQMLEARAFGGDAALLIVAALDDSELKQLHRAAQALQLDVLCEVHDERELKRAIDVGFDIIGVNNRDLRTFQVTLETSLRLSGLIPANALRVAESGIHAGSDISRLRSAGYQAFLIGESLMKESDPGAALSKLLTNAAREERRAEVASR